MILPEHHSGKVCRLVYREHGGFRPLGSAFIVVANKKSWLITNSHVLLKANGDFENIYYSPNGQKMVFPTTLVRDDVSCDLAVFSIHTDIEVDDIIKDAPNIGEQIITIGFPDVLLDSEMARVSEGVVLKTIFGVCTLDGFFVTEDPKAYPCFIASGLDPTSGSSGSPVYSATGEIVGVSKGFCDDKNALCFSGKNIIETLRQLCRQS